MFLLYMQSVQRTC